jgi:hypothetical protein
VIAREGAETYFEREESPAREQACGVVDVTLDASELNSNVSGGVRVTCVLGTDGVRTATRQERRKTKEEEVRHTQRQRRRGGKEGRRQHSHRHHSSSSLAVIAATSSLHYPPATKRERTRRKKKKTTRRPGRFRRHPTTLDRAAFFPVRCVPPSLSSLPFPSLPSLWLQLAADQPSSTKQRKAPGESTAQKERRNGEKEEKKEGGTHAGAVRRGAGFSGDVDHCEHAPLAAAERRV